MQAPPNISGSNTLFFSIVNSIRQSLSPPVECAESGRRASLAWIPTEQNSPDIMLIETAHFRVHRPAAISRNGALIAGLPYVSWRTDLAILANSEVLEAKRC